MNSFYSSSGYLRSVTVVLAIQSGKVFRGTLLRGDSLR